MEWDAPRRRQLLHVALGLILGISACVGTARVTTATITGGGTFSADVTLTQFPCGLCGGGSLSGTATVGLTGLTTSNVPYVGTWVNASLSAAFGYSESCLGGQPAGTVPLVGDADGTFTLTGGTVRVGLRTHANTTLSGIFTYHRIAAAFAITLASLVATDSSGTIAASLTGGLSGTAAGAIRWTNGPGTCLTNTVNPQTAVVNGVVLSAV